MATRVLVLSDLHLDHWQQRGNPLDVSRLVECPNIDVIVVAGDLTDITEVPYALREMSEFAPVIYVPGNHELYGHDAGEAMDALTDISLPNVHVLIRSTATVKGVRFVGAPLWYTMPAEPHSWSDFRHIGGIEDWLPEQSRGDAHFFAQNLRQGDVAVSHFLPSPMCVAPRWWGDETNRFFVHDVTNTIVAACPALWIHGHTHDRIDVLVGATRVVANPVGYPHEHRSGLAHKALVVEV